MKKGVTMKRWGATVAAAVLLAATSVAASTLELYRDGAFYTFEPEKGFVGFVGKGAQARCEGESVALVRQTMCPPDDRLCRLATKIRKLEAQAAEAKASRQVIETLLDRADLKSLDAGKVVAFSDRLGKRMSALERQARRQEREAGFLREAFARQSSGPEAVWLAERCSRPVRLKMPAGWIGFDLYYRAEIAGPKRLKAAKMMKLVNRSGVDIEADRAVLTYANAHRALRPLRFRPWVIRDASKAPRVLYKRAMPMADTAAAPVARMEKVVTKAPRRYEATHLSLPSTGRPVRVTLSRFEVPVTREEMAYPWFDTRVFETLRFRPEAPVESDRWRIFEKGRLVSDRVTGAYVDGEYTLFWKVDEDVVLRRTRLVLKENESFFGGSIHKKDGYEIRLTNQSERSKKIVLIDRIPVAVRSDVTVKLLDVTSKLPMRYRLGKEGRLRVDVTLPPHASGAVRVLFEVSYDRKKPVVY